jgi:hypothetical protein
MLQIGYNLRLSWNNHNVPYHPIDHVGYANQEDDEISSFRSGSNLLFDFKLNLGI